MKYATKGSNIVFICCLVCSSLMAQVHESKFPFEFGIHAGANVYLGDLTPSAIGSYKTIDLTAGFNVDAIISDAFLLRVNYNRGKLRGDDAVYNDKPWRQQRNLKFNATLNEYSAMVVWDILAQNRETQTALAPYIFAGVGYSTASIQRDYSRFNRQFFTSQPSVIAGLNADLANPLPKNIRVLPIGFGVRHSLTPIVAVEVEWSFRFCSSDYLDGFSNAADTKQSDHFYSLVAGLIFSPGKKTGEHDIPCPKW